MTIGDEVYHLTQIKADLEDPVSHLVIAMGQIENTGPQLQRVVDNVSILMALTELISYTKDSIEESLGQVERLKQKVSMVIEELHNI